MQINLLFELNKYFHVNIQERIVTGFYNAFDPIIFDIYINDIFVIAVYSNDDINISKFKQALITKIFQKVLYHQDKLSIKDFEFIKEYYQYCNYAIFDFFVRKFNNDDTLNSYLLILKLSL